MVAPPLDKRLRTVCRCTVAKASIAAATVGDGDTYGPANQSGSSGRGRVSK